MSIARSADDQEKTEILDWLNENNDFIVKSPRYDQLIDNACMFFYKKSATQVSEDTLNFIRRSANELLRNKASKEAMRKRLCLTEEENESAMNKIIRENDLFPKDYASMHQEDMMSGSDEDDSDNDYILGRKDMLPMSMKREKMDGHDMMGVEDKHMKGDITL